MITEKLDEHLEHLIDCYGLRRILAELTKIDRKVGRDDKQKQNLVTTEQLETFWLQIREARGGHSAYCKCEYCKCAGTFQWLLWGKQAQENGEARPNISSISGDECAWSARKSAD